MIREDMVEELLSVMEAYRPFPPEMKPFNDFVEKVAEFREDCKALEDLMSEISSECLLVAWYDTLDTDLWEFVRDGSGGFWYGTSEVSDEQMEEMRRLSEKIGGWVVWDDMTDTTRFISAENMDAFVNFASYTRRRNPSKSVKFVGGKKVKQ